MTSQGICSYFVLMSQPNKTTPFPLSQLNDARERNLTALASVDVATGMGGSWIYAGTELGLTRVPDRSRRWLRATPVALPLLEAVKRGSATGTRVPVHARQALPDGRS